MIYIILAMILYTLVILFGAAASRRADATLVAAVVNTISALIPIALVVATIGKKTAVSEKSGLIFAVLGGVAVAFYVIFFNNARVTLVS